MRSILNKFKLRWFLIRHSLDYSVDILEHVYRIYLNHSKVIHYRDGYPVFSLSTPALSSKPAANFFVRTIYRSIQNRNFPNLLSFAVNDDCNVACRHCSFFEGVDDKTRKVLSLEQSKKMIYDAQELGVSVVNFVGGEPLLRSDLPEIIKSVDKSLSTTVLFTNGLLLARRIDDLKKAGLDSVYISLDSPDSEKNDKSKGKDGVFEAALTGIKKAKDLGLSVGISYCATPESFADGELDKMIEFGKKIGIHEVLVFDAIPTGRYKHREDLMDNDDWIEEMILSVKKYNDDESYPGVLIYAYSTSHRSVGCACGTSYFYVSPYGDIMPCDFNHYSFGNILEKPLYKIWEKMTSSESFNQATWGGCKMKKSVNRQKEGFSSGPDNCVNKK